MRRSSASSARRRSRSAPPISWATSSVSHVASAVGSASRCSSTATVRSKSVVSSHSRCAASKAGRNSTGPRRPTSSRAWGIERPAAPVSTRISSIMWGQASCATASRLARRRRYEATGVVAQKAATPAAASTDPNMVAPIANPRIATITETPANSTGRTSPMPACPIHRSRRAAAVRRRCVGRGAPMPRPVQPKANDVKTRWIP